jgi:hypothetical protein
LRVRPDRANFPREEGDVGEVIPKDGAVDDILTDLRATLDAATVRGAQLRADAERFLLQTTTLAEQVTRDLADQKRALVPLEQAVHARDARADDLLAASYDRIFNELGRPGRDPLLTLMFPGGFGGYTDVPDEEQPDLMDMLVELLLKGVHPGISSATVSEITAPITVAAAEYRTAVDALRAPRTRVKHLTRLRTTLARSGQVQLARLKRHWKAEGMSEADIHQMIPDRPSARPPKL